MNLFYHPSCTSGATEIRFGKEESRHMTKVLRKKVGDTVHITNGTGFIFTTELVEVGPKLSRAKVLEELKRAPLPYQLHMAVAPTKNNDRFEWFLEKATEIGITSITPILCVHSERKVIKPERFERIIENAMKQSLKAYKPQLHPATTFSAFVGAASSDGLKCIAHCASSAKTPLKSNIDAVNDITILIGPEGDFSEAEIELALKNGFVGVSLGTSRLRTETAAIAACHSVSLLKE